LPRAKASGKRSDDLLAGPPVAGRCNLQTRKRRVTQLDISEAWKSATRLVATHRDMLVAIAGVFILLPNLAFAFFFPEPQVAPNLPPREQIAVLGEAYSNAMPLLLPISLIQMAGLLIVIIVMTDRSRPTVATAIRQGALATLPYFGAQILVGMLLATIFVVMATLAGAIGSTAVASAMVMLVFALAATVGLRMALVAPVLACELERNPVSAMRRSWQLTQGSALRLASFLLLALMLFMLIYGLIMLFIGVVLSLTTSGDVQRLAAAIVSSTMTAAAMVYAGAILAAVHRQLAGPPASEMTSTFD
jgi:hypothetical protein